MFKSLIFFEVAYSLYTVSQASRRHWRIGQTDECRVYHLFYESTMEAQAIELVSEKQAAAALLGGDADGGGLAQLSGGAVSLEAELARSIAADEAVVDVSKLFRQTARASADFTSGWATGGQVDESAITVVPLQNLIGKRFYNQAEAHQVVDYGPLDQAVYQVKNLVSGAVSLMAAAVVEAAKPIAADLPLTLCSRKPQAVQQPALPHVPLFAGYHTARQRHPQAIILVERGPFFYAYGEDAKRVSQALNAVLETRLIEGARIDQTAIPSKDLDHYVARLTRAGLRVAVARQKIKDGAKPVAPPAEHVLPATLPEAYARFREARQRDVLTFIEMASEFVSFDDDALTASRRLLRPASVHVQKGGPTLSVLALPRGEHEAAFDRLLKAQHTVALANGRIEVLRPELPQPRQKPVLPRTRSPEQLREMSQGQLALF